MTVVEYNTDMDRVLMGETKEFKVKQPLNGCKINDKKVIEPT